MKLLQVRKGQFVYFKNELHKVYSVKPLAKKSVLMFRVKDMEQFEAKADEVTYYKPKHLDSLMLMGTRYTLIMFWKLKEKLNQLLKRIKLTSLKGLLAQI